MLKKLLLLIFLPAILICPLALADTVYLKSGKAVDCKVIEKTDSYAKVDYYGVELTFFSDEIDKIDQNQNVVTLTTEAKNPSVKTNKNTSSSSLISGRKSFLWKISSKGITAYILGSIHLAKESLYPLDKKIEDAFTNSDTLVVEVDINESNQIAMQGLMVQAAFYVDGKTLSEHISKSTYELLNKRFEKLGVSIEQFNVYKPWFLALTLTNLELAKLGFNPDYGIDRHFIAKARHSGKRILELESFDFQIKLFDQFSDKYQELFLLYTLKDLDMLEKKTDLLMNSWVSGDSKTMEGLAFEGLKQDYQLQPIYEKLFFERNKKMVSKIEEYFKTKGSYFIVVGTGHLVGDKSITEELKNKGYALEQL